MARIPPGEFAFPKERRLRRRREFLEIQSREGGVRPSGEGSSAPRTRRRRVGRFVVLLRPRPDPRPGRLGITVSSKAARGVRRNRIRRLVREAFRTRKELFPRDHDVVVIALTGEGSWTLAEVVEELARWKEPRPRAIPAGSNEAGGGEPARSPGSRSS